MRFFKLASEPYWSFSRTRVWEVVSVALCIVYNMANRLANHTTRKVHFNMPNF